jgi:MFS family permease
VDWGGGALWLLGPAMAISMGLSPFQMGILFAARQIGAGIVQLPSGFIGDNLKRRGTFLLATFWCVSVAQLLASGSTNYWTVVGFLTIASIGAAAWHPVAMGVMTQWMPDRKAFVLGMHLTGGTVAEIAAPLVVGILLSFLSWNHVLQINTIPTIILGLIFIRLAPMVTAPPREFEGGLNIRGLAGSVAQPATLAILLAIILQNMSIVAFMSMAPLYFEEVKGFSSRLTGLSFSLFLIGGAITAPFAGYISDKVGRKTLAIGGLVGGGICALLIPFVSIDIAIFPLLIITGTLMLAVRSVIIAIALEKIGHRESTVLGLISSLGEGFAALGAVLAGITGGIDLGFPLILAAILSVLAGLTILPLNQSD